MMKVSEKHLTLVRQIAKKIGTSHRSLLEAFMMVPRHHFIPEGFQHNAYEDMSLPIGYKQTISAPGVVAKMLFLLNVQPHERVLEIGTGSGYQTALLSLLAQEVISCERIPELYKRTQNLLLFEFHLTNVKLHLADGSMGLEQEAPYHKIILCSAAPDIPSTLISQLSEGGSLVLPMVKNGQQYLFLVKKNKWGRIVIQNKGAVNFVPLIGKKGFRDF